MSSIFEKYRAFYANPTNVGIQGDIGMDLDLFVLKLASTLVFRKARIDHTPLVDNIYGIKYVDYDCVRVAYRSVRKLCFRVRAIDLDKEDRGNLYKYISNNGLEGNLEKSEILRNEMAAFHDEGGLVVALHRSGVVCTRNETSQFVLRLSEKEITFDGLVASLGDGDSRFVRSNVKIFHERMKDDFGCFYLSCDDTEEPANYRLVGSDFFDPVYVITKRYFNDGLEGYLRAVHDRILPDLEKLASPDFYLGSDNVDEYLRVLGLDNFKDAEKIVLALVSSGLKPEKILIRGEGFGFLVYHLSKYFPKCHVFGTDPSPSMVAVAKSFGIDVHLMSESHVYGKDYDFEIMMNVCSLGVVPILDKVILFDKEYLFEGCVGFVTCGGLMFRGLVPFYNHLPMASKKFPYSTPLHRGVIHVEQKEVVDRALATIDAHLCSLTVNLVNIGVSEKRVCKDLKQVTAFAFNSSLNLPFLPTDSNPNYIMNVFDYLVVPGVVSRLYDKFPESNVGNFHYVGVPEGSYFAYADNICNDMTEVTRHVVAKETFYLVNFKINKYQKTYVFYSKNKTKGLVTGVVFFLFPRFTGKNRIKEKYDPLFLLCGCSPPFEGLDGCPMILRENDVLVVYEEEPYFITPEFYIGDTTLVTRVNNK